LGCTSGKGNGGTGFFRRFAVWGIVRGQRRDATMERGNHIGRGGNQGGVGILGDRRGHIVRALGLNEPRLRTIGVLFGGPRAGCVSGGQAVAATASFETYPATARPPTSAPLPPPACAPR